MADLEAVALFQRGHAIWNDRWNRELNLQNGIDFSRHTFDGDANFHNFNFGTSVNFSGARFQGRAQFSGVTFAELAIFGGVVFVGDAIFNQCRFNERAEFLRAVFDANASFPSVRFQGQAMFTMSKFRQANFRKASFQQDALFDSVEVGSFGFERAKFGQRADFRNMVVREVCDFKEARFDGPFILSGARLGLVPDLVDTKTELTPRVDDIAISRPLTRMPRQALYDDPRPWWLSRLGIAHSNESTSRFRKLKGYAVENHDHIAELNFFADEVRTRRFWQDKPSSGMFWLGLAYEAVADFGRSAWRPFILLTATWLVFSAAYFSLSHRAYYGCPTSVSDAALVSFSNSTVFAASAGATQKARECLYGPDHEPKSVAVAQTVQRIVSAVLIFFILLALRNKFRVK